MKSDLEKDEVIEHERAGHGSREADEDVLGRDLLHNWQWMQQKARHCDLCPNADPNCLVLVQEVGQVGGNPCFQELARDPGGLHPRS